MFLRGATLALLAGCAAAPAPPAGQPPVSSTKPYPLRPTDGVMLNLTHMSPLLNYAGDVTYVFTPPGTLDGHMGDDISSSHHILQSGASMSFETTGSAFVVNGWASEESMVRVRELPLQDDEDDTDAAGWWRSEAGKAEWWKLGSVHTSEEGVDERTLVAIFGDGDDGPRRVKLDVTAGQVWISRVVTKTDIPPSDEWGAPHWPIFEGWRGVREYMGAEPRGIWREMYVDFGDIGIEQPVVWALGALEGDADFASVTLSPAPGASYLELRGATPLPEFSNGKYRVRIDPPLAGYNDSWRTVEVAGDTPADIVLFSAALEPAIAYTVTFEARNVGWHWASAWFLAEMGVQPMPRWIGHWGRVRRVFDAVRAKIVYAVAGVTGVSAAVLVFVLARRRITKVQEEDEERQPLLVDADAEAQAA